MWGRADSFGVKCGAERVNAGSVEQRQCGGELAHLRLNVVHKGLNAGSVKQWQCGGELAHLGLNVVHKGLNAGSEKQG